MPHYVVSVLRVYRTELNWNVSSNFLHHLVALLITVPNVMAIFGRGPP